MNFGKYPLLYLKPNLNRNKRELLGHFKIPCITSTMLFYHSSLSGDTDKGMICRGFNMWKKKNQKEKVKSIQRQFAKNLSLLSPLMTTLSHPAPLPHNTESFAHWVTSSTQQASRHFCLKPHLSYSEPRALKALLTSFHLMSSIHP